MLGARMKRKTTTMEERVEACGGSEEQVEVEEEV